jgi:hypothetical protein
LRFFAFFADFSANFAAKVFVPGSAVKPLTAKDAKKSRKDRNEVARSALLVGRGRESSKLRLYGLRFVYGE